VWSGRLATVFVQVVYSSLNEVVTESWTASLGNLEGLDKRLYGSYTTPTFTQSYTILTHTQNLVNHTHL